MAKFAAGTIRVPIPGPLFVFGVLAAVAFWQLGPRHNLQARDRSDEPEERAESGGAPSALDWMWENAAESGAAAAAEAEVKAPSRPRAVATFSGRPLPGASIRLNGLGSEGEGLSYRWLQLSGPEVLPDDPTEGELSVALPTGFRALEFALVVANDRGTDVANLVVQPVSPDEETKDSPELVADAGDDQVAVVGSRVTLNGASSRPRGRVGYRWVQVGGPRPRVHLEDGAYYSFVPVAPGVYRFALVVALDSRISEADEVSVTVGAIASTAGSADGSAGSFPSDFEPLDRIARRSLSLVHPRGETIDELVAIFQDVALRVDLHENYAETFGELSRRLEPIVGSAPGQKAIWTDRVFNPLAIGLVEIMREEGLDLSQPEGQLVPLNQAQRARLAEQFRLIAEGFKAAGGGRSNAAALSAPSTN